MAENHPFQSHISALFSRRSDMAGLINWRTGREESTLRISGTEAFYGHGAFSSDVQTIVATTINRDSERYRNGGIVKIDVETFKIVDQVSFNFGQCHDVVSLGESRFAISSGRLSLHQGSSCAVIIIYDAKTGASHPILSPELPQNGAGEIGVRHLLKTGPDTLLGAVNHSDSLGQYQGLFVEFNTRTSSSRLITNWQELIVGELLNFDVATDGRIWIAMPESRKIVIVNPKNQKVEQTISFHETIRSVRAIPGTDKLILGSDEKFYLFDSSTAIQNPDQRTILTVMNPRGRVCSHTKIITAT